VPDDLRGHDLTPVLAAAADPRARGNGNGVDLSPVSAHPAPAASVQDAVHFTYDDHQAGTATRNAPGQPNRVRAVRTERTKYALYFDPEGRASSEYELYDLERDPLEVDNLVNVRTGEPRSSNARALRQELDERLELAMQECGTAPRIGSQSQ
jgi:arylsulfatase A-like enzyme